VCFCESRYKKERLVTIADAFANTGSPSQRDDKLKNAKGKKNNNESDNSERYCFSRGIYIFLIATRSNKFCSSVNDKNNGDSARENKRSIDKILQ